MTQFACSVILHASVLRLVWRSIKATKLVASGPDTCTQDQTDPSLSLDDEIPQLWTLLAFHTIYAGVLEGLVSWLPFYYYVKMLLLLVTFGIPGTRFPNYWFECWLVPGIDNLHSALDVDWRTYLVDQLRYLPLLLLDLLFVPGILGGPNDVDGSDTGREHQIDHAEVVVGASDLQSPSKSRSRLVASGLQLRKFSREHALRTPAAKSSSSMATPRKKIALESPFATPTMRSLLAQTPATATTTAHGDRSRRRRRRTMNEKFRRVLCGDESIRIRDYLFDLDMPSVPVRGSMEGEESRRVVVSSADRDGDERRREKDERNRRRRRTLGGAVMRREEEFLSSSLLGDERKLLLGEEPNSNGNVSNSSGGGNNSGSSANTAVRRSRRIAKKQGQSGTRL
jgi:hypothetical protein